MVEKLNPDGSNIPPKDNSNKEHLGEPKRFTPTQVNELSKEFYLRYFKCAKEQGEIDQFLELNDVTPDSFPGQYSVFSGDMMTDVLDKKVGSKNPLLKPLYTLHKFAPSKLFNNGYERYFVGQQIQGENLKVNAPEKGMFGYFPGYFMDLYDE
jgi:hypothetical protein